MSMNYLKATLFLEQSLTLVNTSRRCPSESVTLWWIVGRMTPGQIEETKVKRDANGVNAAERAQGCVTVFHISALQSRTFSNRFKCFLNFLFGVINCFLRVGVSFYFQMVGTVSHLGAKLLSSQLVDADI